MPLFKTFYLGILAGVYIAFGSCLAMTVGGACQVRADLARRPRAMRAGERLSQDRMRAQNDLLSLERQGFLLEVAHG